MAIIAEEYHNKYAFTMSTSIGLIRIWSLRGHSVSSKLRDKFVLITRASTDDFIRTLIALAATHLNLENEKNDGEPITEEEISKLSEEELEQISSEIIKHHTYLLKDRESQDDKKENESDQQYLQRLVAEQYDRDTQAALKALASFSTGIPTLKDLAAGVEAMINNTVGNISKSPIKVPESDLLSPKYLLPAPNPQHATNQKLDRVIETLVAQNRFNEQSVVSMERIEKRVEAWEKKSDENSTKTGQQGQLNIWIQVIVGLLALLALILSYMSYQVSLKNQNPPPVAAPASAESPQGEMK